MQWKDTVGRWMTTGLFKETSQNKSHIVYTLEDAKNLYIECGDPTGYKFAKEHLGGWQHWLALKASPKMSPYILQWEEELEAKIRAEGLSRVIDYSKGEKGYQAAKYITEAGWKSKELGRPTKEKVAAEARVRSKMYDEFGDNILELTKK